MRQGRTDPFTVLAVLRQTNGMLQATSLTSQAETQAAQA